MRIISLVPSITELLHSLGLEDEVVGITKFCVHPRKWFAEKPRVGGTKNINIEKIRSLQPTLVIVSKEENVKEQITEIENFCEVHLTDITSFDEALQMTETIGLLTNTQAKAKEIIYQIENNFSNLRAQNFKNALYFIWKNPWMVTGGDTFINSMMLKAGFKNVFNNSTRYPQVSLEDVHKLNPEYILLSSEPYPFKQKDVEDLQHIFPAANILLVDGEMFSWYGSRMIFAAGYFKNLS